MLVRRTDNGMIDVYHQAGPRIERAGYGIGAGLEEWRTAKIEPAILDVTDSGARARIALRDYAGRSIEISVDDQGGKAQRSAEFLALVGAAIEQPTALMLVWMRRFNLVRQTRIAPEVRVDGVPVTLGQLPVAWLHRRHLIKYASDLWVVDVNPPDSDGRREAGRPEAAHARLDFSPEPPSRNSCVRAGTYRGVVGLHS